jgi:hypothetical protein
VTSGGVTETATVTVNVTAVNDAPVANADSAITNENTAVTTGNVLANDIDVDNPLTPAYITAFDANSVNGGTVVNNGDGTFTYTPALNFNGLDTFTYTLIDAGGLTSTATVTITVTAVNSVPSLVTNAGSTVVQGLTDPITLAELHVTDADNTPAQLTYTVTTPPLNGRLELTTAPGVAIMSFTQADIDAGRLVFVHNGAASASDRFTFTVSDGAGGTIGATTFNFTVTPSFPIIPVPVPVPTPVPISDPIPVPGPPVLPGPSPSGVVPIVPPPPVLVAAVGTIEEPAQKVALPSRTFARVEQPDIVPDEPLALAMEPLSLSVKTVLAVGHKLAAHLTRLADNLEQAVQEREQQARLLGRVASFSGMALSVGFVAWILRSGSLLASFLVTMPAWRHFDPLPVLGMSGKDRRKRRRQEQGEQDQENKKFRGLDRVLDKSVKPDEGQETDRVRRPKA